MDAAWLIGTTIAVLGLVLTTIAGVIVRDRQVNGSIRDGDDKLRSELKASTDALHARVNDVREQYVRRDDFEKHMTRIEASIAEVKRDVRDTKADMAAVVRSTERTATLVEGLAKARPAGSRS